MITEFNRKFDRSLSIEALQQQEHRANQLTTYPRLTNHIWPEQRSEEHHTRITAGGNRLEGGNRYRTVDISNGYLHLLEREEPIVTEQQRRANYYHTYCHTHGQKHHHDTNQCRNESFCYWSWE